MGAIFLTFNCKMKRDEESCLNKMLCVGVCQSAIITHLISDVKTQDPGPEEPLCHAHFGVFPTPLIQLIS